MSLAPDPELPCYKDSPEKANRGVGQTDQPCDLHASSQIQSTDYSGTGLHNPDVTAFDNDDVGDSVLYELEDPSKSEAIGSFNDLSDCILPDSVSNMSMAVDSKDVLSECENHTLATNIIDPSIYIDEETRMFCLDSPGISSPQDIVSPPDLGEVSSPFSAMESDGMETGFDDANLSAPGDFIKRPTGFFGASTPLDCTTTPGASTSGGEGDYEETSGSRKKRRKTRREMQPSYNTSHINSMFVHFPTSNPQFQSTTSPCEAYINDQQSSQLSPPLSLPGNVVFPTLLGRRVSAGGSEIEAKNLEASVTEGKMAPNVATEERSQAIISGEQSKHLVCHQESKNKERGVRASNPTSSSLAVTLTTNTRRRYTHHRPSAATPIDSDPFFQKQYPSKGENCELTIVSQPENQHRARYLTEGSRGPVKDSSQQGFPKIQILGYTGPAKLQVFVGTDSGKIKPHGFYQACKVTGRNTSPCKEIEIDGTKVIEIPFKTDNMVVSVDCVGILKLRNSDVEARIGLRNQKRNQSVRLVFRVYLSSTDPHDKNQSHQIVLQTASERINCTQPLGQPEIMKKSLDRCSVEGDVEMFIIGKNFHRGTTVIYQDPEERDGSQWQAEGKVDKDTFHQTHMVVHVPPYHNQAITRPVSVQILVKYQGRSCEPHSFTYVPTQKYMQAAVERNNRPQVTEVKRNDSPVSDPLVRNSNSPPVVNANDNLKSYMAMKSLMEGPMDQKMLFALFSKLVTSVTNQKSISVDAQGEDPNLANMDDQDTGKLQGEKEVEQTFGNRSTLENKIKISQQPEEYDIHPVTTTNQLTLEGNTNNPPLAVFQLPSQGALHAGELQSPFNIAGVSITEMSTMAPVNSDRVVVCLAPSSIRVKTECPKSSSNVWTPSVSNTIMSLTPSTLSVPTQFGSATMSAFTPQVQMLNSLKNSQPTLNQAISGPLPSVPAQLFSATVPTVTAHVQMQDNLLKPQTLILPSSGSFPTAIPTQLSSSTVSALTTQFQPAQVQIQNPVMKSQCELNQARPWSQFFNPASSNQFGGLLYNYSTISSTLQNPTNSPPANMNLSSHAVAGCTSTVSSLGDTMKAVEDFAMNNNSLDAHPVSFPLIENACAPSQDEISSSNTFSFQAPIAGCTNSIYTPITSFTSLPNRPVFERMITEETFQTVQQKAGNFSVTTDTTDYSSLQQIKQFPTKLENDALLLKTGLVSKSEESLSMLSSSSLTQPHSYIENETQQQVEQAMQKSHIVQNVAPMPELQNLQQMDSPIAMEAKANPIMKYSELTYVQPMQIGDRLVSQANPLHAQPMENRDQESANEMAPALHIASEQSVNMVFGLEHNRVHSEVGEIPLSQHFGSTGLSTGSIIEAPSMMHPPPPDASQFVFSVSKTVSPCSTTEDQPIIQMNHPGLEPSKTTGSNVGSGFEHHPDLFAMDQLLQSIDGSEHLATISGEDVQQQLQ